MSLLDGLLFDTNALLEIPHLSGLDTSQGTPLQTLCWKAKRHGLRCVVPTPVLAEFVRNTVTSDTDTLRKKMREPILRHPEDVLPQLDPLETLPFEQEDVLALLQWTFQAYGSQEAYGRYKLKLAAQAAAPIFRWVLSDLQLLGGDAAQIWRDTVVPKIDEVLQETTSSSLKKAISRSCPVFFRAMTDAGLLGDQSTAKWGEILSAVEALCDNRRHDRSLKEAMREAPTNADWLIIGAALRHNLTIVTYEKRREFERIQPRCVEPIALQQQLDAM